MTAQYVRGALSDDDVALLDRHVRDFHNMLARPKTVANLKEAADLLAFTSVSLGQIREQLNKAIEAES
jgi:hypothetical protein